jgi:Ca-activated chloride channel family protein
MSAQRFAWLSVIASLLCARSASAELPSLLRSENSHVRDGNEQLEKGDAKAALESYNKASHELPEAPGVQLNRGLALLKQGEFSKAREALLSATQPNAPADVRADAYADLSLSFYRDADALAGQNKHKDAQKMFREALDASKRSLRLRPGDPNTAWNMELAARRIREEDEKQKQEEEKEKQKQQDNKDNKDQKPDDQNQDKQDKKDGDKQDSDSKKDDQKGDSGDQKDKPQPKPEDGKDKQDQAKSPPKPDKKPEPERQPAEPSEEKSNPAQALPPEAAQALDALEGSEENFERHRARQRAARERRAPEKDW